MRLSDEARHAGRVSDAQMQPEDIFGLVLVVLWVSVAEPVIRALKLEVSRDLFMQVLSLSSSNIWLEI
jgi:hypothetical protein